MWGLGLFFSVQITVLFGLPGLLCFAVPNALGLIAFGLVTHHIARRNPGSESLASFFTNWSRPLRLAFFLYQTLALTLTIFALLRYAWQPLGLEPHALFLPLTMLIAVAAGIFFGEEFNIKRIKFSHGAMFVLVLGAIVILLSNLPQGGQGIGVAEPLEKPTLYQFCGYALPMLIGFLLGPWLDLQQWQRAIEMHRERVSVAAGYIVGALIFFGLLIFHGMLALAVLGVGGQEFVRLGIGQHPYAQEILTKFYFNLAEAQPYVFGAYALFLCICVLTTLDSGYVALRWFLTSNVRASQRAIFSLVPEWLITSPIPVFFFSGVFALFAVVVQLELEYFILFYGTFFVGYEALGVARAFMNSPANALPQVKMFCIGSLAVVIFAYGYFLRYPMFQMIGAVLPLVFVFWSVLKPSSEDFTSDREKLSSPPESPAPPMETNPEPPPAPLAPAEAVKSTIAAALHPLQAAGGYFEGKWFVHTFVATYADTNSVGNVYFGMYAMWVGKTRELFFNRVMPKFNLQTTPFYILTRSFEHKFVRETREFETVSVKIRIADYNRKFVTLEHEIYDSSQALLGKGKQSLLFVSSSDYRMLDIPPEVVAAFSAHV